MENEKKILTPEAERALKEAKARRETQQEAERLQELNGRGGLDPARFNDWEVKGIAVDF
jgi:hypothetical protein